jgi:hypothetical protein
VENLQLKRKQRAVLPVRRKQNRNNKQKRVLPVRRKQNRNNKLKPQQTRKMSCKHSIFIG